MIDNKTELSPERIKIDIKALSSRELYKKYLGPNGLITQQTNNIKNEPQSNRKSLGKEINSLKALLRDAVNIEKDTGQQLQKDVDYSLPPIKWNSGSLHPVTLVEHSVRQFLQQVGFIYHRAPNVIDQASNNFLNMHSTHPARSATDTFYINEEKTTLLRTHTSNAQKIFLDRMTMGDKVMFSGEVFRRDLDSTHTPMFHQLEGLYIDDTVCVATLVSLLVGLIKYLFGSSVKYRIRSAYFPFTEPSIEIDVYQNDKWMELLGAGMIHTDVLPSRLKHTRGLAFGLGLERLAMIKYGISNIKHFYRGDIRVLKQFGDIISE